ncbi:hypothetical protein [Halomonas sp.]|uniref:hypothetical protein n=1 Tax=Halomonas sp. TaxID=1486246 RepID=UPI003D0F0B92
MEEQLNKWKAVVGAAWALAAIAVVFSGWMAYRYGLGETTGLNELNQLAPKAVINMPVIIGCAFQAVASILFATMFSMMNSIYQTSVDIWWQNQRALRRDSR